MKYIPIRKVSHLSNYTYFKYLYLPIVQTYYPLVQTYYSTNVLSINTYSTNVLKYLYLVNPRSSTHVPTTIIGLAKDKYLYSWHMLQNMQIYRYTKQARNSNQTHKKINEYFYSFTSNPKSAILKE